MDRGEDLLDLVTDLEVHVDPGGSPEHDFVYTRMIGSSLLALLEIHWPERD